MLDVSVLWENTKSASMLLLSFYELKLAVFFIGKFKFYNFETSLSSL
jgi:hypothetical protein